MLNRILEKVKDYIIENESFFDEDINCYDDNTKDNSITKDSKRNSSNEYKDLGVSYWVTGHSMGGAVANLVSKLLHETLFVNRI